MGGLSLKVIGFKHLVPLMLYGGRTPAHLSDHEHGCVGAAVLPPAPWAGAAAPARDWPHPGSPASSPGWAAGEATAWDPTPDAMKEDARPSVPWSHPPRDVVRRRKPLGLMAAKPRASRPSDPGVLSHSSLLQPGRARGVKAVTQRPELLRALHTISKASYTNYPITRLPLAFGTADPSHFLRSGLQDAPACRTSKPLFRSFRAEAQALPTLLGALWTATIPPPPLPVPRCCTPARCGGVTHGDGRDRLTQPSPGVPGPCRARCCHRAPVKAPPRPAPGPPPPPQRPRPSPRRGGRAGCAAAGAVEAAGAPQPPLITVSPPLPLPPPWRWSRCSVRRPPAPPLRPAPARWGEPGGGGQSRPRRRGEDGNGERGGTGRDAAPQRLGWAPRIGRGPQRLTALAPHSPPASPSPWLHRLTGPGPSRSPASRLPVATGPLPSSPHRHPGPSQPLAHPPRSLSWPQVSPSKPPGHPSPFPCPALLCLSPQPCDAARLDQASDRLAVSLLCPAAWWPSPPRTHMQPCFPHGCPLLQPSPSTSLGYWFALLCQVNPWAACWACLCGAAVFAGPLAPYLLPPWRPTATTTSCPRDAPLFPLRYPSIPVQPVLQWHCLSPCLLQLLPHGELTLALSRGSCGQFSADRAAPVPLYPIPAWHPRAALSAATPRCSAACTMLLPSSSLPALLLRGPVCAA